ncbi:MAG: D-glycero-beta-D-manno-heptose-7-phosphate kinase [Gemmatimonadetes bacterium]|uniref:D-glycero-beta-D-manno-heptose-7-phosphate kinase n=1 Tax=Candidatus Kutchimonas denitrificans TaxID=3056748 RepID=A0AAE4ZAM3_9BACT|nr:D-glycero-beta-D-manno-heptose-7-phosphate kinase [Gemmatimonadota bacterium]NIR75717.1 D-glycero-beta-D-manno-heptose-7-phosphate kinase [Candidatus Kutchimonas denitrificans]NIS00330.1 D-glycero-beta-D-manno-heptose-7-phosphate kinase [Gemmatimonadota bacterium]NIT65989.1 D-glycero-beta-D-manno-heptose-7-phosphate kinase [Gemmatimonadota bacterium]NIU53693.1 D-glycero-beta-D-manno-heptose-7-phosphate kinase [Gemmatimonadota bacterium]
MPIDRKRIDELLERTRDVRIAVVGDCMLDIYLTGTVGRISPEAPVPVVHVSQERWAPGGAANVAGAVTALGAECELVGVVGLDSASRQLVDALARLGVAGDRLVTVPERQTTTKTRIMARHQHVVRFDRETDADVSEDVARRLLENVEEVADSVDAIILQDYNKGALVPAVIQGTIEIAQRGAIPAVADPKFARFFEYSGVHLFKPNAHELAAALGTPSAPREPDGLRAASERIGCQFLLLTLAEEGMILYGRDDSFHHIHAVARDVFDVSGAGDIVTATVAVCLAAGGTEIEAAMVANYAAGVEVSKSGVVPVRPDEILAALDEHSETA